MAAPTAPRERVLRDVGLDDRLARDGLVATPLVDPARLAAIEAAYWELAPAGESGIVLDYLRSDRAVARRLADLLEPVWDEVVPALFEHHYPVYTSFVVKHPGEGSSLFLHRDLCVDDERLRRTYAMWMPLVDTSAELDNGPLAFVPDSHRIRYGAFGPNAFGAFAPYEEGLRPLLEPMTVPAGTALVYDARMLHASEPNRSDRPRVAVGCLLARRDQPVVQVVATGRRHRVVHEVDRRYFLDHAPADIAERGMPEGYAVLDEFDEDPPVTTDAVLGDFGPAGGRRVMVPGDLEELVVDRVPLAPARVVPVGHRHDLEVAAASLDPLEGEIAGGVRAEAAGAVGGRALTRGRPAPVPGLPVPLRAPRTGHAAVVVVDEGARLVLRAPRRWARRHEILVVECPAVRSGLTVAGRAAEADLGAVFALPPDEEVRLWNDGPGPLVLVVRSGLGAPAVSPVGGG